MHRPLSILDPARRSFHHSTIVNVKGIASDLIRSLYRNTEPPSPEDLASANDFFLSHAPRRHWTANEWRKQNEETTSSFVTPEVVFLGRSNVGKSSLLNALLNSPGLNYVGSRPGKTTNMHAWGVAPSDPVTGGAVRGFSGDTDVKVAVIDMPGYGYGSRGDWGIEIIKYIRRRKQLCRAFLLLHSEHGVKEMDRKMLALLRAEGISHQIVATKCDVLTSHDQLQKSLKEMQQFLVEGRDSNRTSAVQAIIAVGGVGDGRKNDHIKASSIRGASTRRVITSTATQRCQAKNTDASNRHQSLCRLVTYKQNSTSISDPFEIITI